MCDDPIYITFPDKDLVGEDIVYMTFHPITQDLHPNCTELPKVSGEGVTLINGDNWYLPRSLLTTSHK